MKKQLFSLVLALLPLFCTYAARVDTLSVHSASMNKSVSVLVITPDCMAGKAIRLPVIYLLHGAGGNHKTWIYTKANLPQIADRDSIIFICPDGKLSWYWDSPLNPSYCYETFISSELPQYVDTHYPTLAHRNGRAITGLSMGGHGALWNAIRHTDVFGAAGSTSGGVDIRPFPDSWEMKKQLGEQSQNKEVWESHTVINQLDKIKNGDLGLIIDCGYSDFFYPMNVDLHNKLLKLSIDHEFMLRPGGHTGVYWNNSIDYQILFFKKFFESRKKQ